VWCTTSRRSLRPPSNGSEGRGHATSLHFARAPSECPRGHLSTVMHASLQVLWGAQSAMGKAPRKPLGCAKRNGKSTEEASGVRKAQWEKHRGGPWGAQSAMGKAPRRPLGCAKRNGKSTEEAPGVRKAQWEKHRGGPWGAQSAMGKAPRRPLGCAKRNGKSTEEAPGVPKV
jgi:hypothetical protein